MSGKLTSVLVPAFVLGLLGWGLFPIHEELGFNWSLWILAGVGAWTVVRLRGGGRLEPDERLLLTAISVLSLLLVWHDNEMLRALNSMAAIIAVALLPLAARRQGSLLRDVRLAEIIAAGLRFLVRGIIGLIPEIVTVGREHGSRGRGILGPVLRGGVICAVLLPIFGSLLAQADADFKIFFTSLFEFNTVDLAQEGFLVIAWSWLGAAALGGAMVHRTEPFSDVEIGRGQLGGIEVGMVLGAMNLLFSAFIGFQLSHFFGGREMVATQQGLTFATYARTGFFELVVVAALVLPVLLLFESRVREGSTGTITLFRALALVMIGLVFAIMASAMYRMVLYQREFGLTVDRFFASAIMAGLAVTFAWFVVTVLRGAGQRFAGGMMVAWAAWLLLLNIANPDRIIVESNLARAEAGKALDIHHLTTLSADAVPVIFGSMDRLPESVRNELIIALRGHNRYGSDDWRSWLPARARADRLVRENT